MSSLSGRQVGNYAIGPLIGSGGMGEVYRGRDSKLNRDVAIKVLLPAVAADGERLARFNREAQVLASLNHPNIAHIHGIDDSDSGPLLILEFVDGPTLADRIAPGPLPADESIAIAKQIADALEAAHERGIIHRDLKPANIKVDDHGNVKVLDFGLAKALDQGSGSADQGSGTLANSPTITSPAMTQAGMILGTAAYMSPEQAKGRVVDKRSDVWAFGCVLYEMLTGARAFGGEDVTDTIAAVVRAEPDWSRLPADTAPQIRLLLKRCLEKDRKVRISDIGVARFLLNETIDESAGGSTAVSSSRRAAAIAAVALLFGAAFGAGAWAWSSRSAAATPSVVRFEIRPPASQRVLPAPGGSTMAIAPDGSFVVYRSLHSEDRGQVASGLMVRDWKAIEPRLLPDTRNARSPFISPDGRWIGFFGPGELRKVPVAGGPSEAICPFAGAPGGASWGEDDTIVFASSGFDGLQRVPAKGGTPVTLITTGRPKRERQMFPHILPGGRFVLFTLYDAALGAGVLQVVEVATGTVRTLVQDAYVAAYSDTGHLVYGASSPQTNGTRGSIRAVRFDASRAEIVGESAAMVEQIPQETAVTGSLAVSRRGDIVYMPDLGGAITRPPRQLVWVDRKGRETAIPVPIRTYGSARIAPDGSRIVTDVRDEGNDIWIWDLNRRTFTAISREDALDSVPIWMPDGRRVIWASTRAGGNPNLYVQAADGTGAAERLTTSASTHFPTSITPDGRTVLVFGAGQGSFDLFKVTFDGPSSPLQPIVATSATEFDPEISPDGKWLAYHSNESGENQVYVRPFPNVDASRLQVSNAGGSRPAWSRSGRELFYQDLEGRLTSVTVTPAAEGVFSAGLPSRILENAYLLGRTTLGLDIRTYDVTPDGQRFLMIKEDATPQRETVSPRMVVVLNFGEELQSRLPSR